MVYDVALTKGKHEFDPRRGTTTRVRLFSLGKKKTWPEKTLGCRKLTQVRSIPVAPVKGVSSLGETRAEASGPAFCRTNVVDTFGRGGTLSRLEHTL